MDMNSTVISSFIKPIPYPMKDIAERIVELVTTSYPNLDCAIKWKRLTFGVENDFHHWLFALQATKSSMGIVFHFGGLLEDDKNVFIKGESAFLRKLEYKSINDIEWSAIDKFICQALAKLEYFKANWRTLSKESH